MKDNNYSKKYSKIPIVVIIFNRPDKTKILYESLKYYKPSKLLIISDGPRNNFKNEKEKVVQSRKVFEKMDWECEVLFNISETNLGCRERIISGLNWVFNREEKAIILEDDCIPSEEFFTFMELMLRKYQANKKISSVMRKKIDVLDAHSFAKVEWIQPDLFKLTNQFQVTFFVKDRLYDKTFTFKENTVKAGRLSIIPELKKRGVIAKLE